MLILFSAFSAIGATFTVIMIVAWYRGLFDIIWQYIQTMGDIVSGKDVIVHRISIEELLEDIYDDSDDPDM